MIESPENEIIPEHRAIDNGEMVLESSFAPRVTSRKPYNVPVTEFLFCIENKLQMLFDMDVINTDEKKLERIRNCLFGFELASDKLPSFMQMEDIFPLRHDTSTHSLMMTNPSFSTDNSPESHWYNLFTHSDGIEYNKKVAELFAFALDK